MSAPTYFITGYPGFIGQRLVRHLVERAPDAKLVLLVQPKWLNDAHQAAAPLHANVELLAGDVVDMHLGLAGAEYQRLCETVTHLFHLAAVSSLSVPREQARRVNVEGTANVIELARDCHRLRRLVHFSTCYVSGDRVGVVAEDELEQGQSFRNVYEETKYEAERLVERAKTTIPITVVRPASVIGDSRNGEIEQFDGPYSLGMMLVLSPLLPVPPPSQGAAPLNVVPVDYVVRAAAELAHLTAAQGKTVQLVDPNPMSTRRVYALIGERAQSKRPRFGLSARAADLMLNLPGLERLSRPQRAAVGYLNHLAFFSSTTAQQLLEPAGIRCPPLRTYLDKLVDFALAARQRRQEEVALRDVEDPLDRPPR